MEREDSDDIPDVTAAFKVDDEIVRGNGSVHQSHETHPLA